MPQRIAAHCIKDRPEFALIGSTSDYPVCGVSVFIADRNRDSALKSLLIQPRQQAGIFLCFLQISVAARLDAENVGHRNCRDENLRA